MSHGSDLSNSLRLTVSVVTGTSSGLGLAITRVVLERGDIVVATLRDPEALKGLVAQHPPERLLVVRVDVNNRDDMITNAFTKTEERHSADSMLS